MYLTLHNHSLSRLQGMLFFNSHIFTPYTYSHSHIYLPMFFNLKHCPSCFRLMMLPSKSLIPSFSSPPLLIFFCLQYLQLFSLVTCSSLFFKSTMMTSLIPIKKFLDLCLHLANNLCFLFLYFLTCLFSLSQFLCFCFTFYATESGFPSNSLLQIMSPVTN